MRQLTRCQLQMWFHVSWKIFQNPKSFWNSCFWVLKHILLISNSLYIFSDNTFKPRTCYVTVKFIMQWSRALVHFRLFAQCSLRTKIHSKPPKIFQKNKFLMWLALHIKIYLRKSSQTCISSTEQSLSQNYHQIQNYTLYLATRSPHSERRTTRLDRSDTHRICARNGC